MQRPSRTLHRSLSRYLTQRLPFRPAKLACVALLVQAAPLAAAQASSAGEAEVQVKEWIAMMIVLLLAVLILIPSFKSSKRGHQD